jgi:hypothetical protein
MPARGAGNLLIGKRREISEREIGNRRDLSV